MLGADGRPVAPDLAPAFGPFDVDDADENERPIAKRPERDLDRSDPRERAYSGKEAKRGSGMPRTPTFIASKAPASGCPSSSAGVMFWLAVVM